MIVTNLSLRVIILNVMVNQLIAANPYEEQVQISLGSGGGLLKKAMLNHEWQI